MDKVTRLRTAFSFCIQYHVPVASRIDRLSTINGHLAPLSQRSMAFKNARLP